MFGQCESVLIEAELACSMVDDTNRGRQRSDIMAIPARGEELVFSPQFVGQLV